MGRRPYSLPSFIFPDNLRRESCSQCSLGLQLSSLAVLLSPLPEPRPAVSCGALLCLRPLGAGELLLLSGHLPAGREGMHQAVVSWPFSVWGLLRVLGLWILIKFGGRRKTKNLAVTYSNIFLSPHPLFQLRMRLLEVPHSNNVLPIVFLVIFHSISFGIVSIDTFSSSLPSLSFFFSTASNWSMSQPVYFFTSDTILFISSSFYISHAFP